MRGSHVSGEFGAEKVFRGAMVHDEIVKASGHVVTGCLRTAPKG